MTVPQEIKNGLPCDPAILFLYIPQTMEGRASPRYLYTHAHRIFTRAETEVTKWNKHIVEYYLDFKRKDVLIHATKNGQILKTLR
jgi:hypothetical protein